MVVEYDDVVNKQREIIYKRRRKILEEAGGPELDEKAGKELKKKLNFWWPPDRPEAITQAEISQMVRTNFQL